MHVIVEPVPLDALAGSRRGEMSADIRRRVERVRQIQEQRREVAASRCSEGLSRAQGLNAAVQRFLHSAADTLLLSARSYTKVIRVARTIADIEGAEEVTQGHVAEALRYRPSIRPR